MLKLLCAFDFHKKKELECGYPPYSKVWLTVYKCSRCQLVIREWDDMYVKERPKDYLIHENYMFKSKNL